MTVNVVGRSGNKSTVGGETVNVVPAAGLGVGVPVTAPLPHEPSNAAMHAARKKVTTRQIILFIFTKTLYLVLRHHSNNIAKVLARIGILSKCLTATIILARHEARHH